MAVTYGSNLGSNARGAFALIPVTAGAPADSFGILRALSGVIVASDVPLTALQLAALNAGYSALNSGDVDDLGVLSALVGVVSLDSTNVVTLSVVGGVLRATCSAAGKVVVYVPNSAASGIVVGGSGGAPAPTTQRADAVANVPGLFLPGAVAMAVPVAVGAPTVTLVPALSAGYAENSATLQKDFRVEKVNMTVAGPAVAPGAGTLLFNVRFAAIGSGTNQQQATITSVAGDLTVPAGWLYRVVTPAAADATLADVSITVAGTLPR
jgi:hypothetical protein